MANTISTSISYYYKSTMQTTRRTTSASGEAADKTKEPGAKNNAGASVELSYDGLKAYAESQKKQENDAVGNESAAADKDGANETKLSAKAQELLKTLGEKYGDYDFFVTDSLDNSQELAKQGTKKYSVIFTTAELEKMANDEEYADKVMKQVDSAVDMTKRLEERGDLGEGVKFKSITITFDEDGNTKLFAELEKMSAAQRERMEEAKEKRAEEKKEAEKAAKEKEKADKTDEIDEDENESFLVKHFSVEATSEEELLEKILGIDWDAVAADE